MNDILGRNIMHLRKENGMTQEQLANALGISYQAVSKWETGNSSPDISTLPLLADLFSVSIDTLFGRPILKPEPVPAPEEKSSAQSDYPWPDDDCFYMVLYHGHSMIGCKSEEPDEKQTRFVFEYEGPAMDIHSDVSVEVNGDVDGSVQAGGDVNCGDVGGDVVSGGILNCGDVDGSVRANGNVSCGDVGRGVEAGGNVDCSDVGSSVTAGGSVECSDVGSNVSAGGSVNCADVGGSIFAGSGVDHGDQRVVYKNSSENTGRFAQNMANFGDELGKRISDAVQRAVDFSSRFGSRNNEAERGEDE